MEPGQRRRSKAKTGLTCSYCAKNFQNRRELLVHQWTHKERQTYACHICEKAFNNEQMFRKHMAMHSKEEKRFVDCEICNLSFRSSRMLEEHHLKVHSGQKPFVCPTCGISFSWKDNLQKHERVHVDKPFACLVCHEAFRDANSLNDHMKVHKKAKEAQERLKQKQAQHPGDQLIRPMPKTVNVYGNGQLAANSEVSADEDDLDEKPFRCKECSTSFKYNFTLEAHMRGHEDDLDKGKNDSEKSEKSGKSQAGRENQGQNLALAKPHRCPECGESFRWDFCLDAHIKIHQQKTEDDGLVYYQGIKVPKPVIKGYVPPPKRVYRPAHLQMRPRPKHLKHTLVYEVIKQGDRQRMVKQKQMLKIKPKEKLPDVTPAVEKVKEVEKTVADPQETQVTNSGLEAEVEKETQPLAVLVVSSQIADETKLKDEGKQGKESSLEKDIIAQLESTTITAIPVSIESSEQNDFNHRVEPAGDIEEFMQQTSLFTETMAPAAIITSPVKPPRIITNSGQQVASTIDPMQWAELTSLNHEPRPEIQLRPEVPPKKDVTKQEEQTQKKMVSSEPCSLKQETNHVQKAMRNVVVNAVKGDSGVRTEELPVVPPVIRALSTEPKELSQTESNDVMENSDDSQRVRRTDALPVEDAGPKNIEDKSVEEIKHDRPSGVKEKPVETELSSAEQDPPQQTVPTPTEKAVDIPLVTVNSCLKEVNTEQISEEVDKTTRDQSVTADNAEIVQKSILTDSSQNPEETAIDQDLPLMESVISENVNITNDVPASPVLPVENVKKPDEGNKKKKKAKMIRVEKVPTEGRKKEIVVKRLSGYSDEENIDEDVAESETEDMGVAECQTGEVNVLNGKKKQRYETESDAKNVSEIQSNDAKNMENKADFSEKNETFDRRQNIVEKNLRKQERTKRTEVLFEPCDSAPDSSSDFEDELKKGKKSRIKKADPVKEVIETVSKKTNEHSPSKKRKGRGKHSEKDEVIPEAKVPPKRERKNVGKTRSPKAVVDENIPVRQTRNRWKKGEEEQFEKEKELAKKREISQNLPVRQTRNRWKKGEEEEFEKEKELARKREQEGNALLMTPLHDSFAGSNDNFCKDIPSYYHTDCYPNDVPAFRSGVDFSVPLNVSIPDDNIEISQIEKRGLLHKSNESSKKMEQKSGEKNKSKRGKSKASTVSVNDSSKGNSNFISHSESMVENDNRNTENTSEETEVRRTYQEILKELEAIIPVNDRSEVEKQTVCESRGCDSHHVTNNDTSEILSKTKELEKLPVSEVKSSSKRSRGRQKEASQDKKSTEQNIKSQESKISKSKAKSRVSTCEAEGPDNTERSSHSEKSRAKKDRRKSNVLESEFQDGFSSSENRDEPLAKDVTRPDQKTSSKKKKSKSEGPLPDTYEEEVKNNEIESKVSDKKSSKSKKEKKKHSNKKGNNQMLSKELSTEKVLRNEKKADSDMIGEEKKDEREVKKGKNKRKRTSLSSHNENVEPDKLLLEALETNRLDDGKEKRSKKSCDVKSGDSSVSEDTLQSQKGYRKDHRKHEKDHKKHEKDKVVDKSKKKHEKMHKKRDKDHKHKRRDKDHKRKDDALSNGEVISKKEKSKHGRKRKREDTECPSPKKKERFDEDAESVSPSKSKRGKKKRHKEKNKDKSSKHNKEKKSGKSSKKSSKDKKSKKGKKSKSLSNFSIVQDSVPKSPNKFERREKVSILKVKLYSCELCTRAFTKRTSLLAHRIFTHRWQRRSASGDERAQVECAQRLVRLYKYQQSIPKIYECRECGKPYAQRGYLTFHEEQHDTITRTYFCHQCDITMHSWYECIGHQMMHRRSSLAINQIDGSDSEGQGYNSS